MAKQEQVRRSQVRSTRPQDARRRTRAEESRHAVSWTIPWSSTNVMIIGGGLVLLIIGYVLMWTAVADDPVNNEGVWNNANAVVIAPIVLTIAYCIVIPIGIFYRKKRTNENETVVTAE